MKTRIIFLLIVGLIWPASTLKSQQQPEQLNLPGDNLNLYAVMKIFQESQTLEIFEKKLNEEDARINNLDLNGDNYIDYIKVVDYMERNIHYIVLQVAVTASENQDVAVFVVKKDPDGKVVIQLIGDEALYGKYYIVEPYYDTDKSATPNPGYYGNSNNQTVVVHQTSGFEVAAWPLISLIFLPTYVVWHSPWRWGYYPNYWHPWTPWFWHEYYGYHYYWNDNYYSHYHHSNQYRDNNWHDQYYGHRRSSSTTVYAHRDRGDYKASYTKPETVREGSAYFKKMHPDMIRPDRKEPDVKNIRSTSRSEKQPNRINAMDKSRNRMNNNPSMDRTRTGRPENSRSGNVKTGSPENKPGNIKSSQPQNQPQNSRPNKSQNIKKSNRNTQKKPATKETNQGRREGSKRDNPKTNHEPEKSERK